MNPIKFMLSLTFLLTYHSVCAQEKDSIYVRPQLAAEFKGGPELMRLYFKWNLEYPPAAVLRKAEGRIWVNLIIDTFGNSSKVRIARGIAPDMDSAALRVIRSVLRWLPAYHDTLPVKSYLTVPVDFSIKDFNEVNRNGLIVDTLATNAHFPGGQLQLVAYMYTHLSYPKSLEDADIAGRCLIAFHVEKDGKIRNSFVFKSLDPQLDSLSLSIVSKMPNWLPALDEGKPQATWVILPIVFDLPFERREKQRGREMRNQMMQERNRNGFRYR